MKTAGYFQYFEMGTLLNNDLTQDYLSRLEVIPENLSNNLKVAFKPSSNTLVCHKSYTSNDKVPMTSDLLRE